MRHIKQLDQLNDLCDGLLAVPMPTHLDREEVNRKTAEAFRNMKSRPFTAEERVMHKNAIKEQSVVVRKLYSFEEEQS